MKASLISCAFTTSNNNPYILAGSSQRTLDNDYNVNRGWNPNYREGMLGSVLVAMVYFGGPVPTQAILDSYVHTAFVSQLQSNGFAKCGTDLQLEGCQSGIHGSHRHHDRRGR